jgi:hypothetical protein
MMRQSAWGVSIKSSSKGHDKHHGLSADVFLLATPAFMSCLDA